MIFSFSDGGDDSGVHCYALYGNAYDDNAHQCFQAQVLSVLFRARQVLYEVFLLWYVGWHRLQRALWHKRYVRQVCAGVYDARRQYRQFCKGVPLFRQLKYFLVFFQEKYQALF